MSDSTPVVEHALAHLTRPKSAVHIPRACRCGKGWNHVGRCQKPMRTATCRWCKQVFEYRRRGRDPLYCGVECYRADPEPRCKALAKMRAVSADVRRVRKAQRERAMAEVAARRLE